MFCYDVLDTTISSLRLIELVPGKDSEPIHIKLQHAELGSESMPEYTALSYMWKPQPEQIPVAVTCNGLSLLIGWNLWSFLQQYRRTITCNSRLWIDAICIDQQNVRERNHQVAQMRCIYSKASSVIIWLGPNVDDNDARGAFDLMDEVDCARAQTISQEVQWYKRASGWKSLASLLDRQYWSRVWILQEVILAKYVLIWCGDRSASQDQLQNILHWIESTRKRRASSMILNSRGYKVLKHRELWWASSEDCQSFTLCRLLQTYSHLQSSDNRDKIYGLLGIASDVSEGPSPILADYSKTAADILVDVIRNQCQLRVRSIKGTPLRWSVKSWQALLQVTSPELAMSVTKHAPELRSTVHTFTATQHLCTPFMQVGHVLQPGIELMKLNLPPTRKLYPQLTVRQLLEHLRTHISDHNIDLNGTCNDTVIDFEMVSNSTILTQLLYLNSSDMFGEALPEYDSSNGTCCPNPCTPDIQLKFRNHSASPQASMAFQDTCCLVTTPQIQEPPSSLWTYSVFVASNGIIGVTSNHTSSRLKADDLLCVASSNPQSDLAIIVRWSETSGSSTSKCVVGTAMILRGQYTPSKYDTRDGYRNDTECSGFEPNHFIKRYNADQLPKHDELASHVLEPINHLAQETAKYFENLSRVMETGSSLRSCPRGFCTYYHYSALPELFSTGLAPDAYNSSVQVPPRHGIDDHFSKEPDWKDQLVEKAPWVMSESLWVT